MNRTHKRLLLGFGVAALLAAPRVARADAGYNLVKAYTGSAGGDSNFSAGYRIQYGLSASKAGSNPSVGGDARGSSWVKLFGKQFEATSVRATASGSVVGNACNASMVYETYLVGIKIPTLSGSRGGAAWQDYRIIDRTQPLTPTIHVDFVNIAGVAFGLEASASATERVRLNGTTWCDRISASFRPEAKLTATASFRLEGQVVGAGLRGTLTLMDSALPMSGYVVWTGKTNADFFSGGTFCTWQLASQATANFEITPISGKFEPYVRVGFPCTNLWGILPGKGVCLNKEWSTVLSSFSAGKSVYPLAGTPQEIRIGDNTASCLSALPTPPVVRN